MKVNPSVQKYMNTLFYSIEEEETLKKASDTMKTYGVGYLPTTHCGRLTGIVSDRDLKIVMGIEDVDHGVTKIADITSEDPYLASPTTPLEQVVNFMSENRISSALIVANHKLVGVFTSTDALRALKEIFQAG